MESAGWKGEHDAGIDESFDEWNDNDSNKERQRGKKRDRKR